MAEIFDSSQTSTPISYYFDSQTWQFTPTVTGHRFDSPNEIGGTYIFDVTLTESSEPGGQFGAAMYHHLQNLGIY